VEPLLRLVQADTNVSHVRKYSIFKNNFLDTPLSSLNADCIRGYDFSKLADIRLSVVVFWLEFLVQFKIPASFWRAENSQTFWQLFKLHAILCFPSWLVQFSSH